MNEKVIKSRRPIYPWYEDRMVFMGEKEEAPIPLEGIEQQYSKPELIYQYLNERIWKQDKAKKAAAMIMYYTLMNMKKTNAMFVGPTGCGKTEIWRCLQELFPDRIEIVDGSNVTNDGWKGEKKWATLFDSPVFATAKHTILVIDEADKMFTPKFTSHNENVAETVMSEGLKIMEGIDLNVGDGHSKQHVDTRNVSVVFCGAFSKVAREIAEKNGAGTIGFFGKEAEETEAYSAPLTRDEIIDFGVMPEFMGRIQTVVNLEPMTEDDYLKLVTGARCGLIQKLEKEYKTNIAIELDFCKQLVAKAAKSKLGIRGFENMIRNIIDDKLFEDCDREWCSISKDSSLE